MRWARVPAFSPHGGDARLDRRARVRAPRAPGRGEVSDVSDVDVEPNEGAGAPGVVGFIGLGIMGKPMARNLRNAGFELVVHSRSPGPVDELVGAGARRG